MRQARHTASGSFATNWPLHLLAPNQLLNIPISPPILVLINCAVARSFCAASAWRLSVNTDADPTMVITPASLLPTVNTGEDTALTPGINKP